MARLLSVHKHRTILNSLLVPLLLLTRLHNLPALPPLHHVVHSLSGAILHPERETPHPRRDCPGQLRQQHVLTPTAEDRLHNFLSHRLGEQRLAIESLEELRARVALAHQHCADLGGVIVRDQLSGEALVEGHGGGFGGCVVDHGGCGDVAGERGNGDDHAVVVLDHVRQELLGEVVVGEGVDLEGQVEVFLGGVEDGLATGDAGIVDQDRGVAKRAADGGGSGADGRGGGQVALEEADRRRC